MAEQRQRFWREIGTPLAASYLPTLSRSSSPSSTIASLLLPRLYVSVFSDRDIAATIFTKQQYDISFLRFYSSHIHYRQSIRWVAFCAVDRIECIYHLTTKEGYSIMGGFLYDMQAFPATAAVGTLCATVFLIATLREIPASAVSSSYKCGFFLMILHDALTVHVGD